MKEIRLTQSKVALVDDDDYDSVSEHRWYAIKNKNTFYAARNIVAENGKQTLVLMHMEILKTPKGMLTDHKDGNGLNNQKMNLRICSIFQNNQNQRKRRNTINKYKGVFRSGKKYRAEIISFKKRYYLGMFETELEAKHAYEKAALMLHGDFVNKSEISVFV